MNAKNPNVLSEQSFFILLALAEGPRHGYAILGDVEGLSNGRITLSTGTLYGSIKRMLELDWIRPAKDPLPKENKRERRAYQLTSEGRKVLANEAERLESLARVSRLRLAPKGA